MKPIRVMVVDDHTLFRCGITAVLAGEENLEVVGEASGGLEAIEKAKQIVPDVILMDLNILVLTVSDKESDLFAAIKFGARGYILKNTEADELNHAIFHVA